MIELLLKNFVYEICLETFLDSFVKRMISPTLVGKFHAGRLYKHMEYYAFEYVPEFGYWTYVLQKSKNVYLQRIMPNRSYLFKIGGILVEVDEDEIIEIE